MKMKKLIALLLSVFVMAAFAVVPSFAATDVSSWLEKNVTVGAGDPADINARNVTGTRTCKKVYQTFRYTQEAHPISGQGCFSITKGTLKQNGKNTTIYLIASHGLETSSFGQDNDLISCLYAGTEQTSAYLKDMIKIVKDYVPKNANIILAGHSLGGMVSQCSAGDVVPLLSVNTVKDFDAQINDRNREEADVIPVIQSHVDGYNDKDAWKDYDAIGVKNGSAVLKMKDDTTKRFYAVADNDKEYNGSAWAAFDNNGNWTGVSVLY